MSLFGRSPPDAAPVPEPELPNRSRTPLSLLDDERSANSKFSTSPLWGATSTPFKPQTRTLLASAAIPQQYGDLYETVMRGHGSAGGVSPAGVEYTLAAAQLDAQQQSRIHSLITANAGDAQSTTGLDRNEYNVLLALIGLAQQGDAISLDRVHERRRNLPRPTLPGLEELREGQPVPATGAFPHRSDMSPHTGRSWSKAGRSPSQPPALDYGEDPWNTMHLQKASKHAVGTSSPRSVLDGRPMSAHGRTDGAQKVPVDMSTRTTPTLTSSLTTSVVGPARLVPGPIGTDGAGWGNFDGSSVNDSGERSAGSNGGRHVGGSRAAASMPGRTPGSGRTGLSAEEQVQVVLMPEKEGMFLFQHHNYEVASARRSSSKVIRRYSDFVWLLDCLHKRYPFRALPLLPPKRVAGRSPFPALPCPSSSSSCSLTGTAVNGNHLSNDGAFIEKRRRGLARFLNALVRHPVLGQEQLVIIFLTVPTELSVWRKQATISVQDEFAGRSLPIGLEDSLSPSLEELFDRTRAGVWRSADLYISVCNIMDRLVKRSEGVAADHARISMSLSSLVETNADTYASDTNDVPLLNDGLVAMSKHLRTAQTLMEDEARAWDAGVLEDLKKQRDALVGLRDLFERRERLTRDKIPQLEKRIQANETKLTKLRAKQDGVIKPDELEKVVEAIIKDKQSIVDQQNRSVFVRECVRDELVYFQKTQYHVSRWNQDWAQERVKYAEMLADNWRRLLDEVDGMPLGD